MKQDSGAQPNSPLHAGVAQASTQKFLKCVVGLAVGAVVLRAEAVGFDEDDFIIAGFTSDTVGVYDSDLSFKGYLATGWERSVGLDFDRAGNVVSVNQRGLVPDGPPSQVQVFAQDGSAVPGRAYESPDLGAPLDIKVGPTGRYYAGTQDSSNLGGNTLQEFSRSGAALRSFGSGDYEGVAVLPGRILWGGGGNGLFGVIHVWDLDTGMLINSISLDGGQIFALSMHYSRPTNTVLIADVASHAIYERNLDGSLVRTFVAADMESPGGVTRGPNGDLFATDQSDHGVYRWSANGTYLGFTSLSPSVNVPVNIIWAGAVPEPTSGLLLPVGALVVGCGGGRFHRRCVHDS
jgi:hypothetical protein